MLETGQFLSIMGKGCEITIEPRPHYCDRGNFCAKVFAREKTQLSDVPHLDSADCWPRYYFDLDRAKAECEAWLEKREQLVKKEWNQHVS